MRIIGGVARGRTIEAPSGRQTRPTSDRVRQSLFDCLGQRCDGLRVLDLYAGSGALGLEALSRGAAWACFVDNARAAVQSIETNLSQLGFGDRSRVRCVDGLRYEGEAQGFDLIFADPPYAIGPQDILEHLSGDSVLSLAGDAGIVVAGARIVVEHERRVKVEETIGSLRRYSQRRYGDTVLSFYELGGGS